MLAATSEGSGRPGAASEGSRRVRRPLRGRGGYDDLRGVEEAAVTSAGLRRPAAIFVGLWRLAERPS